MTRHLNAITDSAGGQVSRRGAISRMGSWSLGAAVTAAGLAFGSQRAAASTGLPGGCCDLSYRYYCSGLEWSQFCGDCEPDTGEDGYPTGRWWWSCRVSSTQQRFCGECATLQCSYTFVYTGGPVQCS